MTVEHQMNAESRHEGLEPNRQAKFSTGQGRWEEAERLFDEWGRQLNELKKESAEIGSDQLADLERRYQETRGCVQKLREATRQEREEASATLASAWENGRQSAMQMLKTASSEMQRRVGQAREQLDETKSKLGPKSEAALKNLEGASTAVMSGAKEAGQRLQRAWSKLASGGSKSSAEQRKDDDTN